MQKITTHLWFDKEAKQAAEFYVEVFGEGSKIKSHRVLKNTPSGDCDYMVIDVLDHELHMISAGPYFKINPSVSLMVSFPTAEEVDAIYAKLVEGGKALMELAEYPFSKKYAWVVDKFGMSWQIGVFPGPVEQRVTPTMLFTEDVCGKAEEAMKFYTSVFKDGSMSDITRYGEGQEPDQPNNVMYAMFKIEGQEFAAMDSAREHGFKFNEAISFMVHCKDQAEIDYYWEKLSVVPEAEQCGWLKDKYGFSWQITPSIMDEMMANGTEEQVNRVTQAFLQMKKFDIATLEKAYKGE